MRRLLLLGLLAALLVPSAARAEDVWAWTDAEGEVHYTNDAGSIPERFRKSARALGGDKGGTTGGPEVMVLSTTEPRTKAKETEKEKPAPEATVSPQPPPPEAIETAVRPPREDEQPSEADWRSLFRKANDRVRKTERQLQRTQEAMAKLPGMDFTTTYDFAGNLVVDSRSAALKLQRDEDQRSVEDAREQLHDLERAAARDAVPLEWRR